MMNSIKISNIAPQEITITGAGQVSGITNVYVNGVDVTIGSKAYVVVPTNNNELINGAGYITAAEETDPTVPSYVKAISLADINSWNDKQDALVSGTTIKTINSTSLLGSGNIEVGTEYTAGDGIDITGNIISNTVTSYNDLTDLPTIPTNLSELTNDVGYVTRTVDDLEHYLPISVLEDILPSVSDSGTELYLENSAKYKLKLEIEPHEIEQHTTTGKNLLNLEELLNGTISQSDGETITPNAGVYYTPQYIKIDPSTQYSFSCTQSNIAVRVFYYDTDKNFLSTAVASTSGTSASITSGATAEYLRCQYANTFTEMQFEKGTATSFEEYTGGIPAPNPLYPQTIHTNNGDNTIKLANKNLFNANDIKVGYSINASGLETENSVWNASNYIKLEPSTTYTISINTSSTGNATYSQYNESETFINRTGITGTTNTFTTDATTKYLRYAYRNDQEITNIQIERGNTATSYVEHEEIQYPLSLGEYAPEVGTDVELVSIDTQWGKYQNFLYKNTPDNPFYYVGWGDNLILLGRRVYKYIFDPADEWEDLGIDPTYGYTFQGTLNRVYDEIHQYPSFGSTKHYAVCTHFRDRSLATDQTNETWIETMAKYVYIHFPPNSTITTLEDLLDWITNNQITAYIIQGGFADSYAEPIPTWSHYPTVDSEYQNLIDNATAYDGGTNISQVNDDLPLELKASTFKKVS